MRERSGSGWRSGILTFLIALVTFGVVWWLTRRETGAIPTPDPMLDREPTADAPAPITQTPPAAEPAGPSPGPHGPDSAEPLPDGATPPGFPIKGNTRSMVYHTPESPNYRRTRTEVCFRTTQAAEAAGFRHWNSRRRPT